MLPPHPRRDRDRPASARRDRSGRERGASSIELVLYTPLIFFVIFVTIQFALTWHASQVASATAREAARHARVTQNLVTAESRGRDYAAQVGGSALRNVDVDVQQVDAQTIRATVTGQGIEVIPGFTLRVSQQVQGPIEEFRPDVGG